MKTNLLKMTAAVQKALDNEELVLYYQPQINLETAQVSGVEALIRWNHPRLGLISPHKFIPLAEHSNLMTQIGKWILNRVCRQNQMWQNQGLRPLTISVNLSPSQLKDPNFKDIVKDVLKETRIPQLFRIRNYRKSHFS